MPSAAVEMLYRQISKLTTSEKKTLLMKLVSEITQPAAADKRIDFYNIRGVGKEIWANIDAQEYVNKERESWE